MADKKLFHRLKSGPGAEAVGIIPVDMTLGQLRDVDDSAKRDNFVLTYDATTQKYIMVAQTGGPGGGQTSGGGGSVILEAHSGTFLLPTVAQTTLTTTAVNTLVNHYIPSLTGSDVTGFITNTVSGGRGRITFPKAGFVTLLVEGFITIHSTTIGTSGSVGHLVFEADWYSSTGTKKDGFVSSEAIHDASSLAYRDPVSICAGLIPVMANDYIEFKIGFETNVTNKNIRISIPAATDSQRENIDVFFYDRMEVEDWAKKNNATLIPANKISGLPTGGGGLTQSQVDARVRAITSDWAEVDNTDPIPANKLTNAPSSGSPSGGGSSTLTGLTDTPADLGKDGQVLVSKTSDTKWEYLEKLGPPEINEMQIVRHSNDNTLEKTLTLNPNYSNFDLVLLKTKENGELESLDIRLLEKGDFSDQDGYTWDKDNRELSLSDPRKFYYVALVRFDPNNRYVQEDTEVSTRGYQSSTIEDEHIDNFDFVAMGVTTQTSGEIRMLPVDLMKGSGLGGRRFEGDTGTILRATKVADDYILSSIQSDGSGQNNIHSLLPFKAAEVNKIISNWSSIATSFIIPEKYTEYDSVIIVYGTDAQASSTGVKIDEFLVSDLVSRDDLGVTYTASTRTVSMGTGNKLRFAGLVKYSTVHDFDYLDVGDQIQETSGLKEVYSTALTNVKSTTVNKTKFGDVDDTYYMVVSLGGTTVETKQYILELARTSGTDGEITYAADSITYALGNTSTQYIKGIYIDAYRDEGTVIQKLNNPVGYTGNQTLIRTDVILSLHGGSIGICAEVLVGGVRKKLFGRASGTQVYFYDPTQINAPTNYQGQIAQIYQSGSYTYINIGASYRLYKFWYFGFNNVNSNARSVAFKNLSLSTDSYSVENSKTIVTINKSDLIGDKCLLYIQEHAWTGLRTTGQYQAGATLRYYYHGLIIDKSKNSGTDGFITYTADTIKISGLNTKSTPLSDRTTTVSYAVSQILETLLRNDYRIQWSTPNRSNNFSGPLLPQFMQYSFAIIGGATLRKQDNTHPYGFFIGGDKRWEPNSWLLYPYNSCIRTRQQMPYQSLNFYGPTSSNYQDTDTYSFYVAFAKIDDDELIVGSRALQNTIVFPTGWEQADYLFLTGYYPNTSGILDIEQLKVDSNIQGRSSSVNVAFLNGILSIGGAANLDTRNIFLANFKDKKVITEFDNSSTNKQVTLTESDLNSFEALIFSFNDQPSVLIPTAWCRVNTARDFSFYTNRDSEWNNFILDGSTRTFSSSVKNIIGVKAINFGSSNYAVPSPQSNRPALPSLPSSGNFLGLRDTPAQYPSTKKFVVTKPDSTGLEFDEADALDINARDIAVSANNFDNNLSSSDDDLQKVANKVDEGSSTPKRVTRLPANHTEGEEYYLTQEYPSQTFDVTPVTFRGTEFEGTDLGTRGWAKYEHVAEGGGGFDDVGAITPHHPDGLIMISDKKIAVKDGTLQNLRTLVLSVTTGGTTTITSRTLTLAQGTAPLIATSKGNVDTYTYNADLPAGNWDGLYFRDASNRVVGTAMVKKGKYTSFNGDLQPSGFNADDADIDDEIKFLVEVLEKLGRTDKTVRFVTDGSHFFTANNPFMDPRIVKVSYGRDAADTNYYRRYVVFARLSYIDDDVNNTPEAIAVGTKTLNLSYFESDTGGIVRYRSAVTQVAGDRIASSGATKSINVRFKDKSWSGHDQINKYIRNLDISVLRSNILDKIKDYAKKANTTAKIPKDDFSTTLTRAQWTALSTANKRANHVYYITS